jgi:hypothetical protein
MLEKNKDKTKNDGFFINLPIFIIIINMGIIIFSISLFLFFDYIEANRPKIIMIMLNLYIVYVYSLMIPLNIGNTILAIKFKKYYSKIKCKLTIGLIIFQHIASIIMLLSAFFIFLAITNRIS